MTMADVLVPAAPDAAKSTGIKDCLLSPDPIACGVVQTGKSAAKIAANDNVQLASEVLEKGPTQAVTDRATAAAESKFQEALWDLAQSIVDGTQYFFRLIMNLLIHTTEPQVDGQFIYDMGGRIFFIALPLIILFAMLRICVESFRARSLAGARGAAFGAAGSLIGTLALLPLTHLGVQALDSVATGLLNATLTDVDSFVDRIMGAVVSVGTVIGNLSAGQDVSGPVKGWEVPAAGMLVTAIIAIISALLVLMSCVIIGLALVTRNALLYVVIVVGPICLAGLSWGPTRRWASTWTGWLVALLFTKLAIAVVMGLGVLAIIEPGVEGGSFVLPDLATMLSGIMMLVIAAFMPVACFAFFGWMGEASVAAISQAGQAAQSRLSRVPSSAVDVSQSAASRARSVLSDAGGGTVSSGTGGGGEAGVSGTVGGSGAGAAGQAAGGEVAAGEAAAAGTGVGLAAVGAVEAGKAAVGAVQETAKEAQSQVQEGIDEGTSAGGATSGDSASSEHSPVEARDTASAASGRDADYVASSGAAASSGSDAVVPSGDSMMADEPSPPVEDSTTGHGSVPSTPVPVSEDSTAQDGGAKHD
ncbi:type IV secretion system protein [Helcobacillus massiliensis]|uniref:type IV secretion system protein n=1 Tax=Helcobacillus massiliensis TaxID=521392 RepID=UPI0025542AA6|nr:type IV secretion system protein [Helcobacillus massiliensis]WOO93572.1 type IV secretion system protein [Helcobacillus massiliensis]